GGSGRGNLGSVPTGRAPVSTGRRWPHDDQLRSSSGEHAPCGRRARGSAAGGVLGCGRRQADPGLTSLGPPRPLGGGAAAHDRDRSRRAPPGGARTPARPSAPGRSAASPLPRLAAPDPHDDTRPGTRRCPTRRTPHVAQRPDDPDPRHVPPAGPAPPDQAPPEASARHAAALERVPAALALPNRRSATTGWSSVTRSTTPCRVAPGQPRRRRGRHTPWTRRYGAPAATLVPMAAPVSEAWHIRPNGPLVGEVEVRGSKNAVTKHLIAAMLGTRPSTVTNAPDVGDVGITADILTSLGVGVELEDDRITVHPVEKPGSHVPLEFSGLNRIPILLLGPLLARNHEAFVPFVGGDRIGRRPVDFHIAALEAMGAEVTVSSEGVSAKATKLHGAQITLPYPSVGATETVLLSAVLAEGRTVLRNAALEPEVTELALFLQRMGARIGFKPDRRIV